MKRDQSAMIEDNNDDDEQPPRSIQAPRQAAWSNTLREVVKEAPSEPSKDNVIESSTVADSDVVDEVLHETNDNGDKNGDIGDGNSNTKDHVSIISLSSDEEVVESIERPDDSDAHFYHTAAQMLFQKCPVCPAMIELDEGCNHVTCLCDAEFCYICSKKWKTCACPLFGRALPTTLLPGQEWAIPDAHNGLRFGAFLRGQVHGWRDGDR